MKQKDTNQADARQAFEAEAIPHMEALQRAAMHLVRNEMDAQDLVQETLYRAFRFWGKYEPGSNCRAWLFRILKNQYLNQYRVRSRRPLPVDIESVEDDYLHSHSLLDQNPQTTDELFFARRFEDELETAILGLRDELRNSDLVYSEHAESEQDHYQRDKNQNDRILQCLSEHTAREGRKNSEHRVGDRHSQHIEYCMNQEFPLPTPALPAEISDGYGDQRIHTGSKIERKTSQIDEQKRDQ